MGRRFYIWDKLPLNFGWGCRIAIYARNRRLIADRTMRLRDAHARPFFRPLWQLVVLDALSGVLKRGRIWA
jgi:hypothetical protein